MNDNFKFLSENKIYTHEVYVSTCYPEVEFKYRIYTYEEDLGSVQFTATCMGEMYDAQFSDLVLELITSNLTNCSEFLNVEYISHRFI
jgi:hypothetical protein